MCIRDRLNFVSRLANKQAVILDLFGNPYAIDRFSNLDKVHAILVSYEDSDVAQELSAQLIFGGITAKGKLPVTVNNTFKYGDGLTTAQLRMKYTIPQELNINYGKLQEIDSLIYWAIGQKAFPGCQILAVKDGVVFFEKSYGYHTYKMTEPVVWDDIYDIASITKVAATTMALMKLYDEGKFDVYQKMSYYLPELDTTNKKNIRAIDVLTHRAQLVSWIPFYKRALFKDGSWNPQYLSNRYSEKHNVLVSKNVYLNGKFHDEVYARILNSDLRPRKNYQYSDIGFYLFWKIIEKQTGMNIDEYLKKEFYESLGAYTLGYNPIQNGFSEKKTPPTEYDMSFRKNLVQGYVHDYGAAVYGGLGGHAGLFSSANDLAKLFQMLLQNGEYAGQNYLKASTIKFFTTKPFSNSRRCIGFDGTNGSGSGPACGLSSYESYGHTGFTGCIVWADPRYNFIYIFLSNRIYPDIENKILIDENIRAKVQSLLYQSFSYYSN